MKTNLHIAAAGLFAAAAAVTAMQPGTPPARVYFSPHGGCTGAAVEAVEGARHSIRVQAYSFTSRPIADALEAAAARGVDVRVIADDGQATALGSVVPSLKVTDVAYDPAHAIAHNKVIAIDRGIVLTGSFNWTGSAEAANAENLLILRDAKIAAAYLANWDAHRAHSRPR